MVQEMLSVPGSRGQMSGVGAQAQHLRHSFLADGFKVNPPDSGELQNQAGVTKPQINQAGAQAELLNSTVECGMKCRVMLSISPSSAGSAGTNPQWRKGTERPPKRSVAGCECRDSAGLVPAESLLTRQHLCAATLHHQVSIPGHSACW